MVGAPSEPNEAASGAGCALVWAAGVAAADESVLGAAVSGLTAGAGSTDGWTLSSPGTVKSAGGAGGVAGGVVELLSTGAVSVLALCAKVTSRG